MSSEYPGANHERIHPFALVSSSWVLRANSAASFASPALRNCASKIASQMFGVPVADAVSPMSDAVGEWSFRWPGDRIELPCLFEA
jgi:hypothetical protein